ncbi:CFEM domain-containing protein [Apiospora marii]|uniref:CFEM domain-containing protein n=1 Tax=Apiospora marii TaxID=335849 RepID=A0ABR1SHA7_9PEZI
MYFAKAPLLLLYIRLFGIELWLRVACYVTLAATAVLHLVCAIYASVGCIPADGKYESAFVLKCVAATQIPVLLRCFAAIATDVVALVLPLMIVAGLHLPMSRKIGLVLVFTTGIFAMTSGCVSLYYQWRMKNSANSADMTVAMLCTNLECTIAIIVACAPAFNTLWKGCTERARKTSALRASSGVEEAKANPLQQIRVTTHHYMEVDNDNHKRTPGYQAEVMGNRRADWDRDSIA